MTQPNAPDVFEMRVYPSLSLTPALLLAVKGWQELLEKNLAEPVLNISWDHHAVVALAWCAGGTWDPIGVLTWTYQEWRRTAFIEWAYVLPPWRGRKVLRHMHAKFLEESAKLNPSKLMVGTHYLNHEARDAWASFGYQCEAVWYSITHAEPMPGPPAP